MLHFENCTFARRKPLHRLLYLFPELLSEKLSFRIEGGIQFRLAIEEVPGATFRIFRNRSLIFAVRGAPPQIIERHVRRNPIKPCIEAALESEAMQVPVNPQEAFLIDVSRVF